MIRRRRVLWLAPPLIAVLLGFVGGPALRARTTPATPEVVEAVEAVAAARRAGAATWADDALGSVEEALARHRLEHRRQELRLWPLRDFRPVRDSLRVLASEARGVEERALQGAAESRERARAALAEAGRLVAPLEGASAIGMNGSLRREIAQARLELAQGRRLLEAGAAEEALGRARAAARHATSARGALAEATGRFVDDDALARWRRWERETIEWSRRSRAAAVVVYKDEHRLTLFENGRPVRTWEVDLGPNSLFDKVQQGDRATPEGRYRITQKKGRGQSRYYKALLLDYPNGEDRKLFAERQRAGLVSRGASPGGLIEIHGHGGRGQDWTDGCVALPDAELDRLFARVAVGTPVTIVGAVGKGGLYSDLDRKLRQR